MENMGKDELSKGEDGLWVIANTNLLQE